MISSRLIEENVCGARTDPRGTPLVVFWVTLAQVIAHTFLQSNENATLLPFLKTKSGLNGWFGKKHTAFLLCSVAQILDSVGNWAGHRSLYLQPKLNCRLTTSEPHNNWLIWLCTRSVPDYYAQLVTGTTSIDSCYKLHCSVALATNIYIHQTTPSKLYIGTPIQLGLQMQVVPIASLHRAYLSLLSTIHG